MQVNETIIRDVVAQVLAEVGPAPMVAPSSTGRSHGVFTDVDEAVAAAREAFQQLCERPREDREKIIAHVRRISIDQSRAGYDGNERNKDRPTRAQDRQAQDTG